MPRHNYALGYLMLCCGATPEGDAEEREGRSLGARLVALDGEHNTP